MDHRDLYKSISNTSSSRSAKARDLLERRQRQRHDIRAAQRCISEEPPAAADDDDDDRSNSDRRASPHVAALSQSGLAKLTKQQRHHLKYLAWIEQKTRAKQLSTGANKRPFTSAVPANRFVGPRPPNSAPVAALPRSQQFRPPANLPSLTLAAFSGRSGPLNQPIVTRSMAVKALQQPPPPPSKATVDIVVATKKPITSAPTTTKRPATAPFKRPPPVAGKPLLAKPLPKPSAPKSSSAAAGIRSARNLRPSTAASHRLRPPPTTKKAQPVQTSQQPAARSILSSTTDADVDTTAVGAPFTADGSMITSTVQKPHTRRGTTAATTAITVAAARDASLLTLDVFSPIDPQTSPATTVATSKTPTTTTPQNANALTPAPAADSNVTPVRSGRDEQRDINYVSPFVSTSRGKVSARKERKQRESVYKLDLNRSLETPDEAPEVRQRREAALYFRRKLAAETERLGALANQWQRYKTEHEEGLVSIYVDLIDVTTGQTRLLLAKKLVQFGGLVDQCERGGGEQPVLAHDLEGFWSMVYMQVENCDARFERLEQLRRNEWKEGGEEAPAAVAVQRKRPKAKPAAKPAVRGANPFLEQIKKANRQRLLAEQQQQQQQLQQRDDARTHEPCDAAQRKTAMPQKTPRKSMLSTVLCHEAHKSMLLQPTAVAARSILKTPAAKRAVASRGVAFAVTDDNDDDDDVVAKALSPQSPQQRRTRNALRFVCTPMPKDAGDDAADAGDSGDDTENRSPSQRHHRRQTFHVTPGKLERTAEPVQRAADRFSLLDSPVVSLKRLTLNEDGGRLRRKH